MNRKIKFPLIVIVFIAAGFAAVAGSMHFFYKKKVAGNAILIDGKEELNKLFKVYNSSDTGVYGTIRLYDEATDSLKEEMEFSYRKTGDESFTQLGPVQVFADKSITVQLDTLNRYLSIMRTNDLPAAAGKSFVLPAAFLTDTAAFRTDILVTQNGKDRSMEIKSELAPDIRQSNIVYDAATYRILSAEIRWWKDPANPVECWVTKIGYKYHPGLEENQKKRISEVVLINKNKVEINPAYQDYRVYNGL